MSHDEPSTAGFRFAALWLIAFNLQTAIIDSTAKFLAEDLHSVQVTWGYFVAMLLGLTIYSAVRGVRPADAFRTGRPWLQLLRPLLITLTLGMLFTGLAYLPLAEAIAITFMSPLFVTALSVPLLGERVGIHRWLAVLAGVVGMLILVRPAGGVVHWAALLTLGSALAFALFQIVTRRLMATETTTSVLFWTAVGSVLWSSLAVPFFWTPLAVW
jgi:drug/metabolite transporter (DMT)-like permease